MTSWQKMVNILLKLLNLDKYLLLLQVFMIVPCSNLFLMLKISFHAALDVFGSFNGSFS